MKQFVRNEQFWTTQDHRSKHHCIKSLQYTKYTKDFFHKSYQRYLPFFPIGRQPFGMLCPLGYNAFGHSIEFCLGEVVKQHFPIYFLYYASRFTFMTMSFCLSTFYIVGLLIWAPNTPNIAFNNLHLNVNKEWCDTWYI